MSSVQRNVLRASSVSCTGARPNDLGYQHADDNRRKRMHKTGDSVVQLRCCGAGKRVKPFLGGGGGVRLKERGASGRSVRNSASEAKTNRP